MSKKKILFVCPYPENVAPSQRLKFEQYYDHFRAAGYDVHTTAFISPAFWKIIYKPGKLGGKIWHSFLGYCRRFGGLFRLRKYDVVYVHLWVTPFGPPVFEALYRAFARRLVYDIDDLVYLGTKSKANPVTNWIKGRKKPVYLMRHADHVITCTPYLDSFARKYNQRTTDISSTINTDLYRPKTDYSVKEKFIIGWSGSHSTSKYLHLLDGVLRELAKTYAFKLRVMGDASFALDGVDVEALPWKEEYEVGVIRSFDIGLYPLPDEEWILGKSGLKALQYMAAGVPTVATGIGTIHRIIEDGINGFMVKSMDEWKEVIARLITDEALRKRIGTEASKTVEDRYSINANKTTYLSILHRLAAG